MITLLLSVLLSLPVLAYEPVVYPALKAAAPKTPLGGSFDAGEKMLRTADAVEEANAAYDAGHAGYVRVCGFACTAVGVENEAGPDTEGLTIPATSDTHSARNKGYNEAAFDFAKKFNVQMHKRLVADDSIGSPEKKPATEGKPVAEAKPTAGSLSDKDLSINGVTVGKSNLYNATGKFGTNMFKKNEGVYFICWKGEDGTTMAFESDKGGGPDQTITKAILLLSGTDYAHANDCKTSKKVSASSLALAGLHVGSPIGKRTDPPTESSEVKQVWKYETEKKGKTIAQEVEAKILDGKVVSVSVWTH